MAAAVPADAAVREELARRCLELLATCQPGGNWQELATAAEGGVLERLAQALERG